MKNLRLLYSLLAALLVGFVFTQCNKNNPDVAPIVMKEGANARTGTIPGDAQPVALGPYNVQFLGAYYGSTSDGKTDGTSSTWRYELKSNGTIPLVGNGLSHFTIGLGNCVSFSDVDLTKTKVIYYNGNTQTSIAFKGEGTEGVGTTCTIPSSISIFKFDNLPSLDFSKGQKLIFELVLKVAPDAGKVDVWNKVGNKTKMSCYKSLNTITGPGCYTVCSMVTTEDCYGNKISATGATLTLKGASCSALTIPNPLTTTEPGSFCFNNFCGTYDLVVKFGDQEKIISLGKITESVSGLEIFFPYTGPSCEPPVDNQLCTLTQGYWKNHGTGECENGSGKNSWPASAFDEDGDMMIGDTKYDAAGLCTIFNTSAATGDRFIILAHQLIAAKLNVARGSEQEFKALVSGYSSIMQVIVAADAIIEGNTVTDAAQAISLAKILDDYNNGRLTAAGHCK
jgi:hypothetical protein